VTAPVSPYGDSALLIDVDDAPSAHRLADAIGRAQSTGAAPAGVGEAVVGFCTVVVHVDPEVDRIDGVEAWLADLASGQAGPGSAGAGPGRGSGADGPRQVDIPVTFDGPDLDAVADSIGRTAAAVIDLLVGADLQVAFLGFAPGFPYLVGLPPELASVPRRSTPRTSVPAGSVAVGGGFAAVYPQDTPGGWMLLGHTAVRLFDPERPPYTLVRAGDTVRFSISPPSAPRGDPGPFSTESNNRPGAADHRVTGGPRSTTPGRRAPLRASGTRFVEVLDPGLLSLVEDIGRRWVADIGVPRAGAADPETMRLANRLVGNPDGAATIEVTAMGPTLRFAGDAHVAVVASAADGVSVCIDGHPVATDSVSPVQPGQVVAIGRVSAGLRAYVAVAGGMATPLVMGSRSSDMLCGLGPGPLMTGDQLDLGAPTRPHGMLSHPLDPAAGPAPAVIQVILGPHRFPRSDGHELVARVWTVGDASNRIGIRLAGEGRPLGAGAPETTSTAMVTGAIQVPRDGNPIILMPDHATLGGYPVIACAIAADLAKLGQLRPGDKVRFAPVDRQTARHEHLRRERILAGRVSGWFPTEAAT
jgi:KipI family sensor histidine kinase inhibitor